jgi:hypothetical protein
MAEETTKEMSEIVKRLRRGADEASIDCYLMCEEAADYIEALEAALREIADDPTGVSIVQAEIARAALAKEQDK